MLEVQLDFEKNKLSIKSENHIVNKILFNHLKEIKSLIIKNAMDINVKDKKRKWYEEELIIPLDKTINVYSELDLYGNEYCLHLEVHFPKNAHLFWECRIDLGVEYIPSLEKIFWSIVPRILEIPCSFHSFIRLNPGIYESNRILIYFFEIKSDVLNENKIS